MSNKDPSIMNNTEATEWYLEPAMTKTRKHCMICGKGRYCLNCTVNGDNHAAMRKNDKIQDAIDWVNDAPAPDIEPLKTIFEILVAHKNLVNTLEVIAEDVFADAGSVQRARKAIEKYGVL